MTTRLFLISLASTPALRKGHFPADEGLDERGRQEALAARLVEQVSAESRLIISPARLAQDTALLWPMPAQIEPALADMNYGAWRGRALAEVGEQEPAALGAWLTQADASAGGGESFTDVHARVGAWLAQLVQAGDVVALTHAPVIRAAILHALQAPASSFGRIDIPPLTVVALRHNAHGWCWWPSSRPV
ncbi:broad specificity phosphatase PhoE [Silvimonas terrae]|uniref:Broad specificity phosphatase PhoE n=1 Tax=Silvimonas terrae TaxID=300266 RepID=A0A840RC76_9NEIS|nr:histidine phosphatase family protein [Silvimonas terrae]MBB5190955.1 broad specificity phosphatase PhoE [Silvimonas terrae]